MAAHVWDSFFMKLPTVVVYTCTYLPKQTCRAARCGNPPREKQAAKSSFYLRNRKLIE